MHTAWKIASGEAIYVDFFQHHNPLLYYLLAPVLSVAGDANVSIAAARLVAGCFGAGIIYATWLLTRQVAGREAAWLSVTLVVANPIFLSAGVDVRPDVPQVCFGMFGIALAFVWVQRPDRTLLLASAFCTGAAFLFLQKAVIPGIALGLVLLLRALRNALSVSDLVLWCCVSATTALLIIPFYATSGDLTAWYEQNIQLNLISNKGYLSLAQDQWQSSANRMWWMMIPALLLPLAFFSDKNTGTPQEQTRTRWQTVELALLLAFVGGFAFTYRVQYAQYYLAFIPILAVASATAVKALEVFIQPKLGAPFVRCLSPAIALLFLVVAASSNDFRRDRLDQQLAVLDQIRQVSDSADVVYDEQILCNLFRSDLHFFWFSSRTGQQISKYRQIHPVDHAPEALISHPATVASCSPKTQALKNEPGVGAFLRYPGAENLFVRNTHTATSNDN